MGISALPDYRYVDGLCLRFAVRASPLPDALGRDWNDIDLQRTLLNTVEYPFVRSGRLPGDELVPDAIGTLTHAITIAGSAGAVWPWLVQMGAWSCAGWYSYDFLDNGRQASATRIVPELQHITVGPVFPMLPGVTEGFVVLAFEPQRSLILGWPSPDGSPMVTWAFVLEQRPANATRLIVRVRGGQGYRFHGLPEWLSIPAIRLVHFVMQRKLLLGIARRVEASKAALRDAA